MKKNKIIKRENFKNFIINNFAINNSDSKYKFIQKLFKIPLIKFFVINFLINIFNLIIELLLVFNVVLKYF